MQNSTLDKNQQEPESAEIVCPERKFSLIPNIVVGVIVAIVVGGGVYAYSSAKTRKVQENLSAQIQSLQNQIDQLQSEKVGEVEEEPEVDTTNWQTYQNEEYGFEVEYPEGLEVKESDYSEPGAIRFGVRFNKTVDGEALEIFSLSLLSPWWESTKREAVNVESETKIMVGGKEGKRITGSDQRGWPVDEIWVTYNEGVFTIKGEGDIFNQILSTFKFIE